MGGLGDLPLSLGGGDDETSSLPTRLNPIVVETLGPDAGHPALLASVSIWLSFDGGATYEPAVVNGTFDERYADGSGRLDSALGYTWELIRRAGVPNDAQVATYWTELGTVAGGNTGPAVTVTPASGATIGRRSSLQLDFVGGTYPAVEASIAAWVSFDGGARWDAVIRGGVVEAYLYGAGAVKATIAGGWRFTFTRAAGWYRKGMILRASAFDTHGLADGQVV